MPVFEQQCFKIYSILIAFHHVKCSPIFQLGRAVRHFGFLWSAHTLDFPSLSAVQGFSSEREFEDYVKREKNSKRVVVAFVFDHEFKDSHDPLPRKVRTFS